MRRLLPLVLALALAIASDDPGATFARRRKRTRLDGPAWMHPVGVAGHGIAAAAELRAPARQTAAFDAATGTLSWFDDDECYN